MDVNGCYSSCWQWFPPKRSRSWDISSPRNVAFGPWATGFIGFLAYLLPLSIYHWNASGIRSSLGYEESKGPSNYLTTWLNFHGTLSWKSHGQAKYFSVGQVNMDQVKCLPQWALWVLSAKVSHLRFVQNAWQFYTRTSVCVCVIVCTYFYTIILYI